MSAFVQDQDFTLYQGDCLEVLRELPEASVHCCVTSPPYWGLRDYGADGQIGLEATPDEYVARMVAVFGEVRRVLRDDGTLWLNLGDSYAGYWGDKTAKAEGRRSSADTNGWTNDFNMNARPDFHTAFDSSGLKPKDLCGIPWRVAFALQEDGWWLRSDIIWSKPNPMPESVTDRPTKAHEYVFLLTKSARYFFDQEAVREPAEWARWGDQTNGKHEGSGSSAGWIGSKSKEELQARSTPTWEERKAAGATRGNVAFGENVGAGTQRGVHGAGVSHDLGDPARGRNVRSVWEIATQPYAEAHFATFPQELPRRCIAAGSPADGVVLDPFMGSGTTALVARNLGRRSIGIELNADYCALAARRLSQQSLLAGEAA